MTSFPYERYRTRIADLFEEEKRLELQLKVERALAKANALHGIIPPEAADEIERTVRPENVTLKRVKEVESEIRHDLFSMVTAATEACGRYGEYVHVGATSSDIKDTVLALQLKEAKKLLLERVNHLIYVLTDLAVKYRDLVCIGRTHGQHAVPITYGFKFAHFLSEILLARENLLNLKVEYGKMSGAVGTYAAIGTVDIEATVMDILGLECLPITTQVVSRLIHYGFITHIIGIVGVLDRMAGEIRNLQRTEIGELMEPFETKFVGSSAMPQKMNPERSERICGISRYLRQLLSVAHGNISLEHERDLTNSSAERLSIPQVVTLTDFILKEMITILKQLKLDEDRIKHNLLMLNGRQCSENLLKHLVQPLGRQNAHRILRELNKKPNFIEAVKNHSQIRKTLSVEEIDEILNPYNYVGLAPEVVDRVVNKARKILKSD